MSDSQTLSDPGAERAVLAAVFGGGPEVFGEVADLVTVRSFTIDSNQNIWSCLNKVCSEPDASVDYPTLMGAANSLGLAGQFDRAGEKEHLRAILNMSTSGLVNQANARKLAGRVRKLEISRHLADCLDQGKRNLYSEVTGDEPVGKIISTAESPLVDYTSLLANADERGTKKMGDGLTEYLTYLMDNPREMMGISTGLKRFDRSIGGGMRVGAMDVIAARVKVGKSQLVDNIGLNVAFSQGIPCFNLDTEMLWEEHGHRVAANLAGVPVEDIETGACGTRPEHKHKVLEAAKMLRDTPYYYRSVIGEEFEETLAHMRRWVRRDVGFESNGKAKPCVIIFDYLKLMTGDALKSGNLSEFQMMGFIATALKNFAGRYGVPILTFAQLNRDGIDKEDTSVVSQSDRISWFATSLTIFKKKSPDERMTHPTYTHKLVPLISRFGKGLTEEGDYINIRARYDIARIEEGPTLKELEQGSTNAGAIADDPDQEPVRFAG